MAVTQTPLLAEADTAADTAAITVDANTVAFVGIHAAAGIPQGSLPILISTPSGYVPYTDGSADDDTVTGIELSSRRTGAIIAGPVVVIVRRPAGMLVGVYKNT